MNLLNNNGTAPIHPVHTSPSLKVVVAVTCSLSLFGSLLIITSYVLFRHLRTTTRLILVHISLMDFGVATANLVGILVDFNRFYFNFQHGTYNERGLPVLKNVSQTIDVICQIQAAFAVFFTAASILWTLCMAVYLYFRIVHHNNPSVARSTLWASTFFCYSIPALFVFWAAFTHRLGYSPYESEGWCWEKMVNLRTGQEQVVLEFIGYDLWICLTYFLVPVLYVSVIFFLHQELKRSSMFVSSERFWKAVHNLDFKLLIIPVAFLLLRIWSLIDAIFYIYIGTHLPDSVHTPIIYLSGIGDSGQGFVNAILFVVLAKKVRNTLLSFILCRKRQDEDESSPLLYGTVQQQTDEVYRRDNTPHFFSSSHSSSNSDGFTAYSESYRSSNVSRLTM